MTGAVASQRDSPLSVGTVCCADGGAKLLQEEADIESITEKWVRTETGYLFMIDHQSRDGVYRIRKMISNANWEV